MHTVYIGIGSNLGEREENCERAIGLLEEKGTRVIKRSSMIETEPWGVTDQPAFINMAIQIETELSPVELLKLLKETEKEVGRRPGMRWGPRVIDLDILLIDDLVIKSDRIEVPHPQIRNRDFVLRPLAEIAPDLIHPVFKKTIGEMVQEIP